MNLLEHRRSHQTLHGCACGKDFVSEVALDQHLGDYPAKIDVATTGVQCDFCGTHDLERAWVYPCAEFRVAMIGVDTRRGTITEATDWGSSGGWLACHTCSEIIEAGDRDMLVGRALGPMEFNRGPVAYEYRRAVLKLHDGFREHRRGPRRAWG